MWLLWLAAVACLWYLRSWWQYWEIRGIPSLPPWSATVAILGGTRSYTEILKEMYEAKPKSPVLGLWVLTTPLVIARDPNFLWRIMNKDFNKFLAKGLQDPTRLDRLMLNVVNTDGDAWKQLRKQISGIFAPTKISAAAETVAWHSKTYANTLANQEHVDIMHSTGEYSLEVMVNLLFSEADEREQLKDIVRKTFKPTLLLNLRSVLRYLCPRVLAAINWKRFPIETEDCFNSVIRRKMSEGGQDILSDLINVFVSKPPNQEDVDKVAANAYGLLAAGVETTGSVLGFALFELARRPDLQNLIASTSDGCLIDQVISETLRLYPIAQVSARVAEEDVDIDGTRLPRGTRVLIPALSIQRDALYFPNPDTFMPERFASPPTWPAAAYIPFGAGPRMCLGYRLAKLVLRDAISTLVHQFEFSVNPATILPIKFKPNSLMLVPLSPIYLDIHQRNNP